MQNNEVDTPNLCTKCGRLNQAGHECPVSPDSPAMPPGYHPTAGFLKHPQDVVSTHPQDRVGPQPGDVVAAVVTGAGGTHVAYERGLFAPGVDPAERAARMETHRKAAGYSSAGADQVAQVPPLHPDWQASDLSRASIAQDVAEDMARTNAKAAEQGMEIVSSTAGAILCQGSSYKERLLHQLMVRAFIAGASHGAHTATERAIQFGMEAASGER